MESAIFGGWLECDGPPKPEYHDNNCGGNYPNPIEEERGSNFETETRVREAEERSAEYRSNSRAWKKKKCENGDGSDRVATPLSCLGRFLLSEMKVKLI